MKKLALAALFLAAFVCQAQEERIPITANTFVSGGVGMSFIAQNEHSTIGSANGISAGIAAGKWILQPLAMRIGIDVATNTNSEGEKYNYSFANVQFMWDVLSAFGSIENSRVNIYPVAGLGIYMLSGEQSTSNLSTMFGLHVPVRIKRGLTVFAEYKNFIIPSGEWAENVNTATLGVTYNFNYSPYNRRSEYATRGIFEDWFIGYGLGANVATFDFKGWNDPDRYSLMPELMVGRNYTSRWTLRFELSGLFARDIDKELYRYTDLHADVMFNLSNVIDFARGRRLGVMPYIGAGPVWRYDNPIFTMCANGGLFLRYYIDRHSDIFVDAKYTVMPHYVASGTKTDYRIGVGIASLTAGYIYNLGTSTTRYRMPVGR